MATLPSDLSDVTGHNAFTNGQVLTHTNLNDAFGDFQTQGNDTIDVITETDKMAARAKGQIINLGFNVTINSPATGDMQIALTQGDNATNCSASAPAYFNFWETKEALKLTGATTLKLDSTDDFGLDDYSKTDPEVTLYIYAIDRGGTLRFGCGPRPDFTRASADFTTVEGEAVNRDHVFCTAAITANDPCYVVGYFKAIYDQTANDWKSVTSESDVVGSVPGPHPRSICQAWVVFDGVTFALEESFNILTIADNGTGDYTITFDTDFSSINYVYVAAGKLDEGGGSNSDALLGSERAAGSASSFTTSTVDNLGNVLDAIQNCYAFFGDQ